MMKNKSRNVHPRFTLKITRRRRSKKIPSWMPQLRPRWKLLFVQRRITYLLIRWKCSDSRSEAAWPLAHKNVRIANNPWNSFHPGFTAFKFQVSLIFLPLSLWSPRIRLHGARDSINSRRDTLITVTSQDCLENLIKLKFSVAFDPHKHARNSFGSNWIVRGIAFDPVWLQTHDHHDAESFPRSSAHFSRSCRCFCLKTNFWRSRRCCWRC